MLPETGARTVNHLVQHSQSSKREPKIRARRQNARYRLRLLKPYRRLARRAAAVMLAAALLAAGAGPPAATAASPDVIDLPVAFRVANSNTSELGCGSDNADYVVRGHLTGPRSAIFGPPPRAVTVYLYGWDAGEWNWRFRAVPGYDHAAELARLGHVSLTIDMLGYGASGHPYGFESCVGSQADVAHQIIDELRAGRYYNQGAQATAFSKVVLAGHDIGGLVAQIEAYSYGEADGLMVLSWQDQGTTPFVQSHFAAATAKCGTGGESAYPDGPGGYLYYVNTVEDWRRLFTNADPAVRDRAHALRLRNPCGYTASIAAALASETPKLAEISVPVLLALGADDPVWTREGFERQKGHFRGSRDVTSVLLENTGHFMMLERTAPRFRSLVAEWLRYRGLVSAGATGVCARAAGALTSTALGGARLGQRPDQLRRRFGTDTDGRASLDRFCLAGGGAIRIGYLSDARVESLSTAADHDIPRAVLILSTSPSHSAGVGVQVGSRASSARRRVGSKGFSVRVGADTWYVRPRKSSSLLLKARGNRVREVGIANRRLTRNSRVAARFLRRFDPGPQRR
jgi:pimeloyl-ACP methyl ester carboxylesterase